MRLAELSASCGTSVSDSGLPPVVVVSAMAGVTDALLALAQSAASGDRDEAVRDLEKLRQRHADVTAQLVGDAAARALAAELERSFDDLRAIVTAISVLREASPRSLDAVASAGELLSSRIVAEALNAAGVAAQFIDARRAMVTDDAYPAAPIMDGDPQRRRARGSAAPRSGPRAGHRRLRGRDAGRRHDHARTRRLGLLGSDRRCGAARA